MQLKRKRKYTVIDRELIDLALAWLRNEIRMKDFERIKNKPHNGISYVLIARALKVAYRSNLIR